MKKFFRRRKNSQTLSCPVCYSKYDEKSRRKESMLIATADGKYRNCNYQKKTMKVRFLKIHTKLKNQVNENFEDVR